MTAVSELVSILELEPIELDMFRAQTPAGAGSRIYGGQVVAQAMAAAYRTIDDGRLCHSMHGYFMRPGDPKTPILFQVERVRDGGTFAVRRVVALQNGKQIFNLAASFQTPEAGFEHQFDMPAAPAPDSLLNEEELRAKAGLDPASRRIWPVEVRPCDPQEHGQTLALPPLDMCWFRARVSLGDDVILNQCALAYGTDMTLLDVSLRPHAVNWDSGRLQVASLDHSLWFHKASDFSQWHLYVQDSPSASGGRGFNRGSIYGPDGALVASATQEALIRFR
ncbi:MAG: acyl-CoA thioesterase II [Phenylobacterium sp.]|uniref:acyl-CoA thioesterase n=1 Tax=Phenylobacterium sp. TaxID=1871053 RepID=UPI001B3EA8C0|nr:acyl-CoA thioesterase II [Phenylobacterium sp.]MBP7650906.1 acyl-CoA thioesterase II [Phenylobacterium sp.]MBP7816697.1 acyl-CoA thioesterase II [Phenylobacterium sp.]MBP9232197.1 acyl-CoA thioesterase II [Phenylobacterium sp.]MBP9754104.1 acyl-CoA thioesterase II [Phenylobacterium sp.]